MQGHNPANLHQRTTAAATTCSVVTFTTQHTKQDLDTQAFLKFFINAMKSRQDLTRKYQTIFDAHAAMSQNNHVGFSQKTSTTHSPSHQTQEFNFQKIRKQVAVYAGGNKMILLYNTGFFLDLYSSNKTQATKFYLDDNYCYLL